MAGKKNNYSNSLQWIAVGVVVIVFFTRIVALSSFPPILNRDEAAVAYNAKLLLESGRDEWQRSWPLQLQSFGDYKLPGYVFSLTLFLTIFGYTDFAVRLPSVIAGVAVAILTALLAKKFFEAKESEHNLFFNTLISICVAPFAFFYSRMAWEANLALAFLLAAIYFLFFKKKSWQEYILGIVLLIFSIFTYNTPLILFPALLLSLLVHYFPFKKSKVALLLLVIGVFILGFINLQSVATQKSNITIFSSETIQDQYPSFRSSLPASLQTVVGNKYIYWTSLIAKNYIATWSPKFLSFSGGQHPWHTIPGHGHLLSVQLFFAYLGTTVLFIEIVKYCLTKTKDKKLKFQNIKLKIIFFFLLFTSPLPAVITIDAPHATRSLFFFVLLIIVAAYGFITTLEFVRQKNNRFVIPFIFVIVAFLTVQSANYFYNYFAIWPQKYPPELLVGMQAALQKVDENVTSVAFIDTEGYAYTTVAWYEKMESNQFFSTIQRHLPDQAGLTYGYKVGRYTFYKQINDIKAEQAVIFQDVNGEWKLKSRK